MTCRTCLAVHPWLRLYSISEMRPTFVVRIWGDGKDDYSKHPGTYSEYSHRFFEECYRIKVCSCLSGAVSSSRLSFHCFVKKKKSAASFAHQITTHRFRLPFTRATYRFKQTGVSLKWNKNSVESSIIIDQMYKCYRYTDQSTPEPIFWLMIIWTE